MLQYITRAQETIQNQLSEAGESESSWRSIKKNCLNAVVNRPTFFSYKGSCK